MHNIVLIKYKSGHDKMLVGSGSVPSTGWMPVGKKFCAGTLVAGIRVSGYKFYKITLAVATTDSNPQVP